MGRKTSAGRANTRQKTRRALVEAVAATSLVSLSTGDGGDVVELRNMDAFSASGVKVDDATSTIENVSAMTAGPRRRPRLRDRRCDARASSQRRSTPAGGAQDPPRPPAAHPRRPGRLPPRRRRRPTVGSSPTPASKAARSAGTCSSATTPSTMPSRRQRQKVPAGIADQHPHQIGLSVVFHPDKYVARQDADGKPLAAARPCQGRRQPSTSSTSPPPTATGLLEHRPQPQHTSPRRVAGDRPHPSRQESNGPRTEAHLVVAGARSQRDRRRSQGVPQRPVPQDASRHRGGRPAAAFEAVMGRKPSADEPARSDGPTPTPHRRPRRPRPPRRANSRPTRAGAVALAEVETRTSLPRQPAPRSTSWTSGWVAGADRRPGGDRVGRVLHEAAKKAASTPWRRRKAATASTVGDDNNVASLTPAIEDASAPPGRHPGVDLSPTSTPRARIELERHRQAGRPRQPHDRARQFLGLSLIEIGRIFLGRDRRRRPIGLSPRSHGGVWSSTAARSPSGRATSPCRWASATSPASSPT